MSNGYRHIATIIEYIRNFDVFMIMPFLLSSVTRAVVMANSMHWVVQHGPLITFGGTLASAVIAAAIALYVGPRVARRNARLRQEDAWTAHVSDTVRDFRESHAVLLSIVDHGDVGCFPILSHITKLAIPDNLMTSKIIVLGDLSFDARLKALRLESLLTNVNRDVAALVRLIDHDRRATFLSAAAELGDKLYNLADLLLAENRGIAPPAVSERPKTIVYEDGTSRSGVAFARRTPPST